MWVVVLTARVSDGSGASEQNRIASDEPMNSRITPETLRILSDALAWPLCRLQDSRPDSIQNFQLPLLGQLSKEFSGAEIEQVVIEAMRLGFNENREFNNEDILISIQKLVPLARTKSKEIDLLKAWSESGNVTSASKYT